MNDLVKFRIPAAFVLQRLLPTPAELVYGYEHAWIDEDGVVILALAIYNKGKGSAAIERLAILVSDETSQVRDLIEDLKRSTPADDGDPARAWLFLALAWVYENKEEFLDPYEVVEMLYADFGYPPAIEGLVRFMPPPAGHSVGLAALESRWRTYLRAEADWFRARR